MISVCSLFLHIRPLWWYCLMTGLWNSRVIVAPELSSQLRRVLLPSDSLPLRLARAEPGVEPVLLLCSSPCPPYVLSWFVQNGLVSRLTMILCPPKIESIDMRRRSTSFHAEPSFPPISWFST